MRFYRESRSSPGLPVRRLLRVQTEFWRRLRPGFGGTHTIRVEGTLRLRFGRSPVAGKFGELAMAAGGFIVEAEVLEDLHQSLLAAGGVDESQRRRGRIEQLLPG